MDNAWLESEKFDGTGKPDTAGVPPPAKSGAKMTKDENNPNGLPTFGGGPRAFSVSNASMLQANILVLPVADQTGLGGARYDFILKWTPDAAQSNSG